MNKLKLYLSDTYAELMHKTTWPTWQELQSSALIVMVASAIIGVVIYFMDVSFSAIMKIVYGLFA